MGRIVPEIDEIVNFYSPELVEKIAREDRLCAKRIKAWWYIELVFKSWKSYHRLGGF
jgi:hypothetical protein